jgi:hypothetical protein
MKRLSTIVTFLLFCLISNAQFQSRKDVIDYLCSNTFRDFEKEYTVTFKTAEVEFAGSISKQLHVYVNNVREAVLNQSDVSVNSFEPVEGLIENMKEDIKVSVYFDGPETNAEYRGKIECWMFMKLPIQVLIPAPKAVRGKITGFPPNK